MNPRPPKDGSQPPPPAPSPREELEARLAALVLGEAGEFEAETLRARLTADPELAALHRRLERASQALKDTFEDERTAAALPPVPAAPERLSPERREVLEKLFTAAAGPAEAAASPARAPSRRPSPLILFPKYSRHMLAAAAALLVAGLIYFVSMQSLSVTRMGRTFAAKPEVTAAKTESRNWDYQAVSPPSPSPFAPRQQASAAIDSYDYTIGDEMKKDKVEELTKVLSAQELVTVMSGGASPMVRSDTDASTHSALDDGTQSSPFATRVLSTNAPESQLGWYDEQGSARTVSDNESLAQLPALLSAPSSVTVDGDIAGGGLAQEQAAATVVVPLTETGSDLMSAPAVAVATSVPSMPAPPPPPPPSAAPAPGPGARGRGIARASGAGEGWSARGPAAPSAARGTRRGAPPSLPVDPSSLASIMPAPTPVTAPAAAGEPAMYAGVLSGGGNLSKEGSGAFTLTGANTYNSTTAIAAGTLQIGNGTASGTVLATILDNGSVVFNESENQALAERIGGDGGLTKSGNGMLTLSAPGSNTFSGSLNLTTGGNATDQVVLGKALGLQDSTLEYQAGSGALSFGSLTHSVVGGLSGNQNVALGGLSGNRDVNLTNSTAGTVNLFVGGNNEGATYSGNLSGAGSVIPTVPNQSDTGARYFNAARRESSSTTTLDTNGNNVILANPILSGNATVAGEGILSLTGATTYTGGAAAQPGATNRAFPFSADVSQSGGTVIGDNMREAVQNPTTATGSFNLNTVRFNEPTDTLNVSDAHGLGTGTMIIAGGNLDNTSGSDASADVKLTKVGAGAFTTASAFTTVGAQAYARGAAGADQVAPTVGGNGSTYTGAIGGLGSFNRDSAGNNLTLSAANTFTGVVIASNTSHTGNAVVWGGSINFSSVSNFGASNVAASGGDLRWAAGTSTDTSGNLKGQFGGIIESRLGILTVSGNNSFVGSTVVNQGTLQLGDGTTNGTVDGAIVNNGALIFNQAGKVTNTSVISGTGTATQTGVADDPAVNFGTASGDPRAAELRQLLERGRAAYGSGDYNGALKSFEAARSLDPGNTTANAYQKQVTIVLREKAYLSHEITREDALLNVDYQWRRPIVYAQGGNGTAAPLPAITAASKAASAPAAPTTTDQPVARPPSDVKFPPPVFTADNAFSTFSLNVSDASYRLALAALQNRRWPDPAATRTEEFLNAFRYRDPAPRPGQPAAFHYQLAQNPFESGGELLRASFQTAAAGRDRATPLRLTIVLDNSGSMTRADRVATLQAALRALGGQLRPGDAVSLVTFARTAQVRATGVAAERFGEIAHLVDAAAPDGGTNIEEALMVGYQIARETFLPGAQNRVILMTDGAANLGELDPQNLALLVEQNRRAGIALDAYGVGWDGYDDAVLESLTRNSDGRYAFLNRPEDVDAAFAAKLAGALAPAAADVKLQIEFNPNRVASYRLMGYNNQRLTKEQFRDNTVNAAELAAAEQGTALYNLVLKADGSGPIGTARARFRDPATNNVRELQWTIRYGGAPTPFDQAPAPMRLAAVAAYFAEYLQQSPFAAEVAPRKLMQALEGVPETFAPDPGPAALADALFSAAALAGN